MKAFIDGDQLMIVRDGFVDLQTSKAVFIPLHKEIIKMLQELEAMDPVQAGDNPIIITVDYNTKP